MAWPRCCWRWVAKEDGPEAGLDKRASAPEVRAYYDRVLDERLLPSGNVAFYPTASTSAKDGSSRASPGGTTTCAARGASSTPEPLPIHTGDYVSAVRRGGGEHAIAVNDLATLGAGPSEYVIVGSGKTATDPGLAARERRRSWRDLLGAPSRALDAERAVVQPNP